MWSFVFLWIRSRKIHTDGCGFSSLRVSFSPMCFHVSASLKRNYMDHLPLINARIFYDQSKILNEFVFIFENLCLYFRVKIQYQCRSVDLTSPPLRSFRRQQSFKYIVYKIWTTFSVGAWIPIQLRLWLMMAVVSWREVTTTLGIFVN